MPRKIDHFSLETARKEAKRGKSAIQIASQCGISFATAKRIKKKLGVPPISRGGRPTLLSERTTRFCCRAITKEKGTSCRSVAKSLLKEFGISLSRHTVNRALKKKGLKARKKKKKPFLTRKQQKLRLAWAKKHSDWTVCDWNRVVWSDETKINRFGSDGNRWHWIRPHQEEETAPTANYGGGGILIWSCITSEGYGFLKFVEGTMDASYYKRILKNKLMETLEVYEIDTSQVIFQQDGAACHKAKTVYKWLRKKRIRFFDDWSPNSPDLNPIEKIWNELKSKLNEYDEVPLSIER